MKKNKAIVVALAAALLLTNIVAAEAGVDISNENMVSLRGINRNPYRPKKRSASNDHESVPTPTGLNHNRSRAVTPNINTINSSSNNQLAPSNPSVYTRTGVPQDPRGLRRLMKRPITRSANLNAISLITDGVLVNSDLPAKFFGTELLLPMDIVSDVIGASYTWDEANRQFSISYKDRFIRLSEGDIYFLAGDYLFDDKGSIDKVGKSALVLETAPVVSDSRMYAPFKMIAEELKIYYSYSSDSKTVAITTMLPSPTVVPTVTAYPDTPLFKKLSGKRLQQLYDSGVKFVALLYNGNNEYSEDAIRIAKTAAETAGFRVFGVDMDAPDNELGFIGNGGKALPAMIFCFSKDDISYLELPADVGELSKLIANVKNGKFFLARPTNSYLLGTTVGSELPIASPSTNASEAVSPSPTVPEATPIPLDQSSDNWNVILREEAESKFRLGEKFIYVCFNSAQDTLDNPNLLLIKEAVDKANVPVYVSDIKYQGGYWFGWDYTGYYTTPVPTVYFIKAANSVTSEIRPTSSDELAAKMSEFMRS